MSSYKTISTYSSGWDPRYVKAPVMLYQNTPIKQELVPSYGTVGYASGGGSTYRGYSSLCSGYNDAQSIGCGFTDPTDPCYEGGVPMPSQACLDLMSGILTEVNKYKIKDEYILRFVATLNEMIFDDLNCVNIIITGQSERHIQDTVNSFVQTFGLVKHELDRDGKPIVRRSDIVLYELVYNPNIMEIVNVPLPFNEVVAVRRA
jgi:hypothetical protein